MMKKTTLERSTLFVYREKKTTTLLRLRALKILMRQKMGHTGFEHQCIISDPLRPRKMPENKIHLFWRFPHGSQFKWHKAKWSPNI